MKSDREGENMKSSRINPLLDICFDIAIGLVTGVLYGVLTHDSQNYNHFDPVFFATFGVPASYLISSKSNYSKKDRLKKGINVIGSFTLGQYIGQTIRMSSPYTPHLPKII